VSTIQRLIDYWTTTNPPEEEVMATLSPEQRARWKAKALTPAQRRAKRSLEETTLDDLLRSFIAMRIHHQQALRAHQVTSAESLRFDIDHEALRSRILRTLDRFNDADPRMVSAAKSKQVRSILRERTGANDLHRDVLPESPVKTSNNKVTGVTSATYRDGRTETYRPAPKGATMWNPVTARWESPGRRTYVGGGS